MAGAVSVLAALPALAQEDVAEPQALVAGVCSFADAKGLLTTWECETEDGTTPTTIPPTTTTTPPTTTEPPTTTTQPPTTTTTEPPPTTTTTQPPTPGPDPTPIPGAGSYDIFVIGRLASPDAVQMWRAPYYHELSSGAGWDHGDRNGYRGAYGFLHHKNKSVFRFFFAGGYGGTIATLIGDERMNEAERYYDCTRYDVGGNGAPDRRDCDVVPGPEIRELRDAPLPSWIGSTVQPPDRRPVIRVIEDATGDVIEVRSYVNPVALDPGTTFAPLQHITDPFLDSGAPPNPNKPDPYDSGPHTVYERFVVGAWLDGDNAVSVYYDILRPGYHLDVSYPLED